MSPDENRFLLNLEAVVEVELTMAESSNADGLTGPPGGWLFDPIDDQRGAADSAACSALFKNFRSVR